MVNGDLHVNLILDLYMQKYRIIFTNCSYHIDGNILIHSEHVIFFITCYSKVFHVGMTFALKKHSNLETYILNKTSSTYMM